MKTIRKGLYFLIGMAACAMITCPVYGQDMTWHDQVARMKANPPYTGPELWGKVMTLIGRRDGFMTTSDINEVMAMKLEKTNDLPEGGFGASFPSYSIIFSYTYKTGKLNSRSHVTKGAESILQINWPFSLDDKKEQCIPADMAINDLVKTGWMTFDSKPDGITEFANPNYVMLNKHGGFVELSFTGTYDKEMPPKPIKPENACITSIQVNGKLTLDKPVHAYQK